MKKEFEERSLDVEDTVRVGFGAVTSTTDGTCAETRRTRRTVDFSFFECPADDVVAGKPFTERTPHRVTRLHTACLALRMVLPTCIEKKSALSSIVARPIRRLGACGTQESGELGLGDFPLPSCSRTTFSSLVHAQGPNCGGGGGGGGGGSKWRAAGIVLPILISAELLSRRGRDFVERSYRAPIVRSAALRGIRHCSLARR